jgi:hypothetical protein
MWYQNRIVSCLRHQPTDYRLYSMIGTPLIIRDSS